jgi:hypothetical protein
VLGVAGLVAILSHPSPTDPIAPYRDGLVFIVAFFAAAGAVAAALLAGRPAGADAPVPAAAVRVATEDAHTP